MSSGHVLLVGAGHAHLEVVRRAQRFREAGLEVTLVAPDDFRQPGIATSVLSGAVSPDQSRISVARHCQHHGVNHIVERVLGMSLEQRLLWLGTGRTLVYDAVSFDVGSEVDMNSIDSTGSAARIWPVRPARRLLDLHTALRADMAAGKTGVITVVGGGASGCEAAATIAALVEGSAMRVVIVTRGNRLWPEAPHNASRWLMRDLANRGVDILLRTQINASRGRCVYATDGRRFVADHVVLATGLKAPGVIRASGLPASDKGLAVEAGLYSPAAYNVFAAGDCADFMPRRLTRQNMHGIRQAPILAHNLVATVKERAFRNYRPVRHSLKVVDLGNGIGIACRGRWWWHGRRALALKQRREKGFMACLES